MMTTQKALTALKHIKTYCNAAQLVELDYVIEVLEKLEKAGVQDPLSADFKLLAK